MRALHLLIAIAAPIVCLGQGTISTAAGNGTQGFSGDGGPATNASISGISLGVAVDNGGNLLVVDGGNNRVRMVNGAGIITTIAGGGPAGSGDGVPATKTQVFPGGVAVDHAGNMYIAQGASIRKVDSSGIITTIAGTGLPGFGGDGGAALKAQFMATNVAVDGAGNIYIADTINQRIRKIDGNGIISTVAGAGQQGFSGDGGPATSAKLALPQGLSSDSAGNLYFADSGNGRVRKVDTSGTITTVAGNGSAIGIGENVPATSQGMTPAWVAVDTAGNLYITDNGVSRIRKVNTAGLISTFAGSISATSLGDGGPATSASLSNPTCVAVDAAGNVYIADANHYRVRKVSVAAALVESPSALSLSAIVGGAAPASQNVSLTGSGATLSFTAAPSTTTGGNWLSVTPTAGTTPATLSISISTGSLPAGTYNGDVTITSSGAGNSPQQIPVTLTVQPAGTSRAVITTVAGNGSIVFSGDGGPATSAGTSPVGIAADSGGNVYFSESLVSGRIRKVDTSGTITTIAGNGTVAFAGDGGPATKASFFNPFGLVVDSNGNIYIADSSNNRIRKINTSGTISTAAGNGSPAYAGDGGPATSASIASPLGVALDTAGNLYIAENSTFRVRKVNTAGIISTAAGSILGTFSGDGGSATSAGLLLPGGVATDTAGNLYIADVGDNRIRKVNTSGIISTYAGSGTKGFAGDGGPATSAALNLASAHIGLAVDSSGNLYIPDCGNQRIRKVDTAGIITTVAGNGTAGFSGDGGSPTSASLNNPSDVAIDGSGNLYIVDTTNLRIRKIPLGPAAPSISANGIVNGASFQPGVAGGAWVTITGSNLSTMTDVWTNAVVNGKLPTTLDGVSVMIGGKPAYVEYVSQAQINLLAPNIPSGPTQVTVITPAGTSASFAVTASQYGPAFFPWPNNQVVATYQDFTFAAKPGTFAGVNTVAARPRDVVILWATGFGATSPAVPDGFFTPGDQTYATLVLPTVTINNVPATVYGAALAPGFAGLYQVAVQVPASLADGDWAVVATIGGISSPSGAVLSVKK